MKPSTKTDKLVFKVKPALDIAEALKCKVISDKTINFTKARAFSYLELETFEGERQVNERHVQFLYNNWVGGRFMWDHVIIAQARCDGKFYRINGQHTCWMRVNLPDDYFIKKGEEPQVREVVYEVPDEENLRTLYSTFDQNKTRSAGHVFKALLVGTNHVADVWPSVIGVLGSGLKHWLYEPADQRLLSANDMAEIVRDKHESLFRIVGLYFQSHYNEWRASRRAAVIGAMFATFDASGGKAPEFWDPVITGLNLVDKSDPRYALRKWLETHYQGESGTHEYASAEDTYRVCILAWNKWRTGQKAIATLRPTDKRVKAR